MTREHDLPLLAARIVVARTRTKSLRRRTLSLVAVLCGAVACEEERRPSGLVDAQVVDVALPDVIVSEAATPDVTAGDTGLDADVDGGLDAARDAADASPDVPQDAPIEECCADADVLVARPIAPRSGGYVATRRPAFRWTPQAGAVTYRVEIGASRAFTTPSTTLTTDGATTITATSELLPGRYWWRVVPVDRAGATMTPTATWSVIVGRVPNDLNGDGYADIVIGAPEHDAPMLTDIGRVQVFYGGGALDATADLSLDGTSAGEAFGRALSTSGDLNGDGFADIAIGAPFAGVMQTGRVAVYLGGATIATVPAVTITGTQTMSQFGRNVAIAGDLNGDGYDDLLVSTPFYRGNSGPNSGRAWVYLGGAPMNGVADVEFDYSSGGDQLGFSSSPAGDVNGDGFADIAVGAPRNGVAGVDSGAAYIWWGSSPMDTGVDMIVLGLGPGSRTGDAITTLGDYNADGYSDFAVGATGASTGGPNAGAVLGFGGTPGVIPRPLFTINGAATERLGTAISGGGDLDADGFDDLLLGARDNSVAGALSGRAYAYRGNAGLMPSLGATYSVSMGMMTGGDEFGHAVGILGDVNADGYDDLLVGAPNAPFMGTEGPGRAYLFVGGSALALTPRQTYVPVAAGAFGQSVARR